MNDRLTFYQVAQRYNVAVSTLYSWVNRGWIIAPKRLGGRVFWTLSDLEAWEAADFPRPCDAKDTQGVS